jgi:hypothetical protein
MKKKKIKLSLYLRNKLIKILVKLQNKSGKKIVFNF